MSCPASAGDLRETIAIQSSSSTEDAGGGVVRTWATVSGKSAVRAKVETVSANERLRAEQLGGEMTHRVTVRYDSAITRNQRILWDSRTLYIVAPPTNVGNRNRWLTLECGEKVL